MNIFSSNHLYVFEGCCWQFHQRLIKAKAFLLTKEEKSYIKKIAANFATFLDQNTFNQTPPSKEQALKWVLDLNQAFSQKETSQVKAEVFPLSGLKTLVRFYNLRKDYTEALTKTLKIQPYVPESKNPLPDFNVSYNFNLFLPEDVTMELLFKNLPSVEKRQKSLAEDVTGNNWLIKFPENEWPERVWQMLEFLKTEEGMTEVACQIWDLQKIKFITTIKQLK